jgi:Tol biopolymer transport system component
LRSFSWSADGKQLAILGNSQGRGNIYLTNLHGTSLQPVLANSQLGYLMDAAWSRDGKQFVMWSLQNNKVLYLMSTDGTDLKKKQLDVQIIGTPQFTPDGKSVVFYGGDTQAVGLFQLNLATSETALINPFVEDPSGFAFSPDGSLLAYLEYDRNNGEARLFTENRTTGERTILGKFPIPKQPGSSLPDGANLGWSADGELLVFDLGFTSSDRAIYLAHADGSGLAKIADAGYAPTISADGKCLAYINNKKLFLLDLTKATSAAPLFVADLPTGRAIADVRLDKLQWKP